MLPEVSTPTQRSLLSGQKCFQAFRSSSSIDELELRRIERFYKLVEMGKACHAGRTPRGPELQDHDLPLEACPVCSRSRRGLQQFRESKGGAGVPFAGCAQSEAVPHMTATRVIRLLAKRYAPRSQISAAFFLFRTNRKARLHRIQKRSQTYEVHVHFDTEFTRNVPNWVRHANCGCIRANAQLRHDGLHFMRLCGDEKGRCRGCAACGPGSGPGSMRSKCR